MLRKSRKSRKFLAGLLSCTMAISMLPNLFVSAQEATVETALVSEVSTEAFGQNPSVFKGENFEVSFNVLSKWDTAFNADITIKNTSDKTIENWAVTFDMPYEIASIWNSVIDSNESGTYVIKNAGYNQDINAGQSVSFGFTANTTEENVVYPATYELLGTKTQAKSDAYEVSFKVTSDWQSGFNGEIAIKNISDKPIEDWQLEFDFNHNIPSFWEAEILSHEGNHYVIKNRGYNANIQAGQTLTLGFGGNPGNVQSQPENYVLTYVGMEAEEIDPDEDGSIQLFSNKNEILATSCNETVYFYAALDIEIPSISLIDTQTNQIVSTLVDDGNYPVSGDDIMGDGVYSSKMNIDTNVFNDTEYSYYATIDGHKTSNIISIDIFVPFIEQELSDMKYVDNTIKSVMLENATPSYLNEVPSEYIQNGNNNNDEFDYNELFKKRCDALRALLEKLVSEGKVDSFNYDETNNVFNCQYSNGIPFFIVPTDLLESVTTEDDIEVSTPVGEYDGYSALILNTFEDTNYRTKYYEKFVKNWRDKGMNVDYDDEVTVLDLKSKLSNKDIIALSGHGMVFNQHSVFCLGDDEITTTKDTTYNLDITTGRIDRAFYADGTNSYVVTPDFFTHYYGNSGLNGSFVFSESCMFMGSEDEQGFDDTFANAFIDCSTEAVIGFENSVMADYSRELMLYYFEELLKGSTALEAFNNARAKYGDSDYEYRKPSFLQYLFDHEAFEKMGAIAFPHLTGNNEAVLVNELKNGYWESPEQILTSVPFEWEYTGDVRVLSKLGDITPYGSRMAFLSTGIGSNSGVSVLGTQGSTLYQTIKNTNKSTIQFNYDFISEEPMEFVGSSFDDKFEIQILDSNDNILYSEELESINISTWYHVSGINFDGGDNTIFHTAGKTASIDISAYQNQSIKIKFLVYDVGDSAYDTAVVLDNIKCF